MKRNYIIYDECDGREIGKYTNKKEAEKKLKAFIKNYGNRYAIKEGR